MTNSSTLHFTISDKRGYPTAFDGKKHYRITFESISVRNEIDHWLHALEKLPDDMCFVLTEGVEETVAKICRKAPEQKEEETQEQLWSEALTEVSFFSPHHYKLAFEALKARYILTRKQSLGRIEPEN